jgi:hypothetical protein
MDIKISILLLLVLFTISWIYYKRYLILKYRYNLYAFRDKFRDSTISGSIDNKDWTFDYLDSSISKAINELPLANFWTFLTLTLIHKNDKNIVEFSRHLDLSVIRNKEFEKFYNEFGSLIGRFIVQSHIITLIIFIICSIPFISSLIIIRKIKIKVKNFIINSTQIPEGNFICYS